MSGSDYEKQNLGAKRLEGGGSTKRTATSTRNLKERKP